MVPEILTQYKQWVVFNGDKIALSPHTLRKADSTRPDTWASYQDALAAIADEKATHIGFVFSSSDPFCLIDLDDHPDRPATDEQKARHELILNKFSDTYIEQSISGRGHHIIIKGSVPSGTDRDNVAIYPSKRYVLLTGKNINGIYDIADYSELVTQLWEEAKGNESEEYILTSGISTHDDDTVIEKALKASNANKFKSLCRGEWSGDYPSQSEADLALLSILCFYSKDDEQVTRIFRLTELGKRKKAQRDSYIHSTIKRIRVNEPPELDFSSFKVPSYVPHSDPQGDIELPPGLTGEIASYIFQSSIRPVPEVAIGSAIALMAGIAGRAYNVSGTGLNQYIILLAKTGSGKEGAASGIDRIIHEVRKKVPMAERVIGPGAYASGQALIRVLNDRPCFVSILGEFGITLQQLSSPRASSVEKQMKRVLLDLYGKSGHGQILQSAVYSDTVKNTQMINAPAVSLFGESTPETFYEGLDLTTVAEGLLPRFTVIEYKGLRPPRNENAFFSPPENLVRDVSDLIVYCQEAQASNSHIPVIISDEAASIFSSFDRECDSHINYSHNEIAVQLYNRGHLKALKLAALLAVGVNFYAPVIDKKCCQWAINTIKRDIEPMSKKFTSGNIGNGDSKQVADVIIFCRKFIETPKADSPSLESMRIKRMIPHNLISRALLNMASFRKDKNGATNALKKTILHLIDSGVLIEANRQKIIEEFNSWGKVYVFTGDSYHI